MNGSHYELLANLFDYPTEHYAQNVQSVEALLEKNYPEAAHTLKPFGHEISSMTIVELQELFTRSFDVQAATTLDVGYVLFGDDYKRGELLVNLNREHRDHQVNCGCELSDHLPNVLRLIAKLKDLELRNELVSEIIAPALQKMISDFDPIRLERREVLYKKYYKTVIEVERARAIMFGIPLNVLYQVLREDFRLKEKQASQPTSDFLRSVNQEIEIEHTQ